MEGLTVRGREVIGMKGILRVVYRIISRKIFMLGKPSPQYYQMLNNFKAKSALKRADTVGDWCCLELVDEIPLEYLHGKFIDDMVLALESSGFKVEVKDLL